MFTINDDLSIYVTRGDRLFFTVTAVDDGAAYVFQPGDIVRFKVFGKKDATNVVLQKDFPVTAAAEKVEIYLTEQDTKIGDVISKPKDYWYEVELNPYDHPQTIIGYDEDGAKVFRLLPEGRDVTELEPDIKPEDIPVVDKVLDMTSLRPVQNQAIARAVAKLEAANSNLTEKMAASDATVKQEIAVERARIDNLATLNEGSTTGDAELADIRVDAHGIRWNNAGNGVRGFTGFLDSRLNAISMFKTEAVETVLSAGYYNTDGVLAEHGEHKHTELPVVGGEVYVVNTYYGYVAPDALVLDGDGNLIHYYHTNTDSMTASDPDAFVVIPEGAQMLVVNVCSGREYEIRKVVGSDLRYGSVESYTTNIVKSLVGGVENLSENLCTECTENSLIPENGKVSVIDNEAYVTAEVKVSPGERLRIEYGHNYTNYGYIFLDDRNAVISASALGDGTAKVNIVSETVTAPFNAVKLVVAHITTHGVPCAYKIQGYKDDGMKWRGVTWVCVGDSLTEKNSRTEKNYHDYVAEKTGINVVNMGVSGSGYMRGHEENQAFYQRIADVPIDADVVTIFGSGNDLSLPLGAVTDNGTDTLCGCINTTINKLLSIMPTVQLGIITPAPWESYPPATVGNKMELYANAIVEICKRWSIPCLDLYHCSNLRPWDETFKSLAYSKDNGNGVHPDETGHKIIATRFKAFLESLMF